MDQGLRAMLDPLYPVLETRRMRGSSLTPPDDSDEAEDEEWLEDDTCLRSEFCTYRDYCFSIGGFLQVAIDLYALVDSTYDMYTILYSLISMAHLRQDRSYCFFELVTVTNQPSGEDCLILWTKTTDEAEKKI